MSSRNLSHTQNSIIPQFEANLDKLRESKHITDHLQARRFHPPTPKLIVTNYKCFHRSSHYIAKDQDATKNKQQLK